MNKRLILAVALCLATSALGQVDPALSCPLEPAECTLPSCHCSSSLPPMTPQEEIPQLVYLTFDDAVSVDNYAFYDEVLFHRTNPNDHPITATFFITHEYTNYSMVNDLWRFGHDVALHSISHNPSTSYWAELSEDDWRAEVVDQREQISTFARIPPNAVTGMRAPFLQTGGDAMYAALSSAGFGWECSRPTLNFRKPGLWPYTNDYASTQDCQIGPCPIGKYPGFWTVPMIDMLGGDRQGCAMVDTCTPVPATSDETYDLLLQNFNDHYEGTRAPFGVFTHSAWLNGTGSPNITERRLGYVRFLDYLDGLDDVYIVSVARAVEWMKTPTPLSTITEFAPFHVQQQARTCASIQRCRYPPELTPFPEERYMDTCTACPPVYPWVHNHLGRPPLT